MPTPQPPAAHRPTPGHCTWGVHACGAKARFYPAGWRCAQHAPGQPGTMPRAVRLPAA